MANNPRDTFPWYCCDRKSRVAWAQSFALWQQATIEFTCHDHSPRTLVVTFNLSHVNISRASTPRSLFYCLFAPHICMVLFFTHIPFVVNHTFNSTPPERLQQYFIAVKNILLHAYCMLMYACQMWCRNKWSLVLPVNAFIMLPTTMPDWNWTTSYPKESKCSPTSTYTFD